MSVGELTDRVRQNYTRGVLSNQITATVATITSADFTTLPEVLQGDQFAMVSLDPDQVIGAPELIKVTEHAAGSDTVICERHAEGTLARIHPVSTVWRLVSTAEDFALIETETATRLAGYLPLAGGVMVGDLDMGAATVRNLPFPDTDDQAVTRGYGRLTYLALTGGTLTGQLAMSGQKITGLGAATLPDEALSREAGDARYVQPVTGDATYLKLAGGTMAGTLAMAGHNINGLPNPVAGGTSAVSRAEGDTRYSLTAHVHPAGDITSGVIADARLPKAGLGNLGIVSLAQGLNNSSTTEAATASAVKALNDNKAAADHNHNSSIPTFSGLKFDELIPYHGGTNGSLRWIGVNAEIAQNHTSSSLDYKDQVEAVDLDKSVFSRLDPIHFQYRDDHPFRDRWDDWDTEARSAVGRMGVTFEQVAEVVPEWTYDADGMKCVSYDAMLPDLIADYLALRRLVLDRLGV